MANILLTAIGSVAAQASFNSLSKHGHSVFACDIYDSKYLPFTSGYKTIFKMPSVYENESYISSILKICSDNKIEIIIPLTDPECDLLSSQKEYFEKLSIKVACFNEDLQVLSRNKLLITQKLKDSCLCIPTYNSFCNNNIKFPIMLKPISGRSSQGQYVANSKEEYECFKKLRNDYIVQPYLEGDIFTIDCARDTYGNFVSLTRQEILRTVNGLGLSVKTFKNHDLDDIARNIANELKFIGTANMEFIFNKGKYYFLEINPRFSGGIGFSLKAGYDFINAHLLCHMQQQIESPNNIKSLYLTQGYSIEIKAEA